MNIYICQQLHWTERIAHRGGPLFRPNLLEQSVWRLRKSDDPPPLSIDQHHAFAILAFAVRIIYLQKRLRVRWR